MPNGKNPLTLFKRADLHGIGNVREKIAAERKQKKVKNRAPV